MTSPSPQSAACSSMNPLSASMSAAKFSKSIPASLTRAATSYSRSASTGCGTARSLMTLGLFTKYAVSIVSTPKFDVLNLSTLAPL